MLRPILGLIIKAAFEGVHLRARPPRAQSVSGQISASLNAFP
jgi:hypothetical protein